MRVDEDFSACGSVEVREELDERRFATAVCAYDDDERGRWDGDGHVFKRVSCFFVAGVSKRHVSTEGQRIQQ